jgi:hypothetical protein
MPYVRPARLTYWEGRLPYVNGVDRGYVAGASGYSSDGSEHYDPILGYYKIQDHAVANALPVTDYSVQIAAGVTRYRDRAIRDVPDVPGEEPGTQEYHRFLSGIARHHAETADAADVEAANILLAAGAYADVASFAENYSHVGVQRETALLLMACLDREAMGLGEHAIQDHACAMVLGLVDQWTEPAETKRYGVWLKPFMGCLGMRALIAYWTRYRESADPTKADLVARIPGAVDAFNEYVWTNAWYDVGVSMPFGGGTWDKGALSYMDFDHGFADALMAPITGLAVTAVGSPADRVFRGPGSLSAVDGHYIGASVAFAAIADYFLVVGYTGSTRQFTLAASYNPSRDITTADTFSVQPNPINRDITEGPGAVPDLNHMWFPALAWSYWHAVAVEPDPSAATTRRARAVAVFDGAQQSWADPINQKQRNQSNYWTTDGLGWLEAGDLAADAGPTGTVLFILSPQGGWLHYQGGA